jgi:single-strand DNA-binding protein
LFAGSSDSNESREWVATAHPFGKHVPHPADKPKETELDTMFNKVILIGRLGQNAEAKTAKNNKEYVVLNIATQESRKNDKGEYETRTEWHRVYAWSNLSKFAKTLQKGQLITLKGLFGIASTKRKSTGSRSGIALPRSTPPV